MNLGNCILPNGKFRVAIETEKAIRVIYQPHGEAVWIPKSQTKTVPRGLWIAGWKADQTPGLRAACEPENVEKEYEAVDSDGDFSRISAVLETAFGNGVERPTITVVMSNGRRLRIVRARRSPKGPSDAAAMVFSAGSTFARITQRGDLLVNPSERTDQEALDALAAFALDPAAAGSSFGRQSSTCCFCARMIKTKASLSVGYGPICAERYGLPWGDTQTLLENSKEGSGSPWSS